MQLEPEKCTHCNGQAGVGQDKCTLLMAAYILAGLAMMLNIRLSYSSAPYALIRFKLPENLFSVFVRRMASALELWCLPSMLLGNIMDYGLKGYFGKAYEKGDFDNHFNLKDKEFGITTGYNTSDGTKKIKVEIIFKNIPNIDTLVPARLLKFTWIIFPSIVAQWLNFLTYVILFFVYVIGGDQGHLTLFYFVIAISGVVFGINMVLVYAADWNYTPVYIVGENTFPIVTSFMHYIATLIFGNRRRWNSDFLLVLIDIWVAILISFVAAIVWTLAYGYFLDTQKNDVITFHRGGTKAAGPTPENLTANDIKSITVTDANGESTTYNNVGTETKGSDAPGTPSLTIKNTKDGNGETTATFKKDEDLPTTNEGGPAKPGTIILKYNKSATNSTITLTGKTGIVPFGHIFTETFDTSKVRPEIVSPTLMVIVGMGLVYSIYPGIAPGMIVPFYLIDKIEMVLLIATFFPPVIVALLNKGSFGDATKPYSPKSKFVWHPSDESGMGGWRKYASNHVQGQLTCDKDVKDVHNWFWHFFDILIVIKISLAAIFIYSLHYRDSDISRSIINQPKMSTALSITFYMCHEILLALGFAGVIGNNGGTYVVLPAQYVGALFMIFLAFYSEGYIIEYKSHDPAHWPTEGMTLWI